jgi:hypothetical protein
MRINCFIRIKRKLLNFNMLYWRAPINMDQLLLRYGASSGCIWGRLPLHVEWNHENIEKDKIVT